MKHTYHIFLLFAASFFSVCSFGQYYSAVEFIENKGQWDKSVRFRAEVPAGELFIHSNGFTVVQHNPQDWEAVAAASHPHPHNNDPRREYPGAADQAGITLRSHAYRVEFVGASPVAFLTPDKALPTFNNYILGNDPAKWAFDCKIYQGITIQNLYPNIDIRYYSDRGRLKYDLIVRPGGDPAKIKRE